MGICTGAFVDLPLGLDGPPGRHCIIGEIPLNPNVLFDAGSTEPVSRSFQVVAGEAVLLDPYQLCGSTIQVERLAIIVGELPLDPVGSCACFPSEVIPPEIASQKDLCGWVLTECSQPMSIITPGTYRLRIDQQAVGCALVYFSRQTVVPYRPTVSSTLGGVQA